MEDLYSILGVPRTASTKDITTAFRKLARKLHPDVNPGNATAEGQFKRVSAAHDVLSDPERRAAYDEFGELALQPGFDLQAARQQRDWQRQRHRAAPPAAGGFGAADAAFEHFDLGDLLGSRFGWPGRSRPAKGDDLHAIVELELAQAIRGTEVTVNLRDDRVCGDCAGTGFRPKAGAERCPHCRGTGRQEVAHGQLRIASACPACGGHGGPVQVCPSCAGRGKLGSPRSVTVRIPPGADDGSILRIPRKGAQPSGSGQPGDLVIETRVRPHPLFVRDGLDLHLRLPVTLDEAYDGAHVEIPTLTGKVRVRIPPGSQSGSRLRLRGKGVGRGGQKGDLIVELQVRLPERRDERLAEALRNARTAYAESPRQAFEGIGSRR